MSIIKEPKFLFGKTQLKDKIYNGGIVNFIESNMRSKIMGFYGIMVVE